jgi:hypothetical protein
MVFHRIKPKNALLHYLMRMHNGLQLKSNKRQQGG